MTKLRFAAAREHISSRCSNPYLRAVVPSRGEESAQPLKWVGKTETIDSMIFINLFFNQDVAMSTTRFRQDTGEWFKHGLSRCISFRVNLVCPTDSGYR
jgi:hypothetical protein